MRKIIFLIVILSMFSTSCLFDDTKDITFKGRVFDSETKQQIEGARVYIDACGGSAMGQDQAAFCSRSDGSGFYTCRCTVDCRSAITVVITADYHDWKVLNKDDGVNEVDCDGNIVDAYLETLDL